MAELEWTYDPERRFFHVRFFGVVGLDALDQTREIRRTIDVELGRVRCLYDARDSDMSELTADAFKSLEAVRVARFRSAADRAAGLVRNETDLGIVKLWSMYRNHSAPGSTAAFLSEREAMAWLFSDEEPEG